MEGIADAAEHFPWGNVQYYRYTGGPPAPADAAAIAAGISTNWNADVAGLCNTSIRLQKVTVTDLSSTAGAEGTSVNVHAGTRAGVQLPANSAVLISYPTANRYRGGHPRTYLLAGVAGDTADAAHWSGGFTGSVLTAWQAFLLANIGLVSGTTAVVSLSAIRYYGKFAPNSGPPRYRLLAPQASDLSNIFMTVDPQIASQRRRIGRRKA
jgi:hypothetical protein